VVQVHPEARPAKHTAFEHEFDFKGKTPKKKKAPLKRKFVPNHNRRIMTNKEKNHVSGSLYTSLIDTLRSVEEAFGMENENSPNWADQNPPPTWLKDTLRKILNENHIKLPDRAETQADRDLSLQANLYNNQFMDKIVNDLWIKALGKPCVVGIDKQLKGPFESLMATRNPGFLTKWAIKKAIFEADLREKMAGKTVVKPEGLNLNNLPIVADLRDIGVVVTFVDGTSMTGRGVMVELKKNGESRRGLVIARHVLWPDKRSDGRPSPKGVKTVKVIPPGDQPIELIPLRKATDPKDVKKIKKAYQVDFFGDDIDLLMLRSNSLGHLPVEDISVDPIAGKILYTEFNKDIMSHPFFCMKEADIMNVGDYSTEGPGSSGAGIRTLDTQNNVKVVGFHVGCIREGREGLNSWISVRALENLQPLPDSSG